MNITINKFKKLCDRIKIRAEETFGYNEIEDLLLQALDFIKNHKSEKDQFANFFTDKILQFENNNLVYGNCYHLVQVIQFCMRELQWVEIKEAALKTRNVSTDWRIIGTMEIILEVYEKEWPDDELYKYFCKKIEGR
jgi:hypothetical protein